MLEEMQEKIKYLENKVDELTKMIWVVKRDHSFDMKRAFEEIDKMKGEIDDGTTGKSC